MKSLKVNDKVLVIAGDHKGTEAKIIKIDRAAGKACLEGVGVIERRLKKTQYNPNGGKKIVYTKIDLSNLKLAEGTKTVKSAVKKVDKAADKKTAKAKKGAK